MAEILKLQQAGPMRGVTIEVEEVTPAIADKWLDANIDRQRPLRKSAVEQYTRDMVGERWIFDGSTVCFSDQGRLIDGQHRLSALIKANVTLPFIVVRGLTKKAFLTKDTGKVRSSGDILSIDGYKEIRNELARFLRLVCATNFGEYDYKRGASFKGGAAPTNQDIQSAFELLREESVKVVRKFKSPEYRSTKRLIGVGDAAYFYWLFCQRDKATAEAFFDKFETGEGLERGNPILTLRNKLITDMSLMRSNRWVKLQKAAYLVKAWNALRNGKEIRMLRYGESEDFPEIN